MLLRSFATKVSMLALLFSLMWLRVFASIGDSTERLNFKQYCVVGAGPGGLQIAYYLNQANRDYIVFEKGPSSGTFYKTYPIHRKLISINKRYTGKKNKEFNLRHDWNSLISHDESLRMTKYSKEFFPSADVLVQYLNDFATKLKLNVQYDTTIGNILKRNDGIFVMNDQTNKTYTCEYLIIATGIAKPHKPEFSGSELVEGYEDLSLDVDDYAGQNVLIIGRGNSAFEVAQHIMPATSLIHMMGRSRVKLAWATHYVGDLRAVNDGILDTYQLKSLDGLFESSVEDLTIVRSKLDGRLYIVDRPEDDYAPGGEDPVLFDNDATREGYDRIIRCLGFTFDDSIFHKDMSVRRGGNGRKKKYPKISFAYEALGIRNLFFAGANTHSLDFRKSAGAFIHGYRYTARTLHRMLEWRNHGVKWPHVHFSSIIDLIPHIVKRLNEASDIYQMFSVLCDVVIFSGDKSEATYLEAVPCALASRLPRATGHSVPGPVMMIALEYGKNFSGPGKDPFHDERATAVSHEAHRSNFLHPIFYYYETVVTNKEYLSRPHKWILPLPDRIHHLVEDFTTKFDAPQTHILSLRRFMEQIVGQDLRLFYADKCMMLALTMQELPLGCRKLVDNGSSQFVALNPDLETRLAEMPTHMLPFRVLPSYK